MHHTKGKMENEKRSCRAEWQMAQRTILVKDF